MSYVPGFAPDAQADWRELDVELQERVLDEMDRLAANPPPPPLTLFLGDFVREIAGAKQYVWYRYVRVPLIVAGPGSAAGQRTGALCYLFDVLPTLGKRCGVSAPPTSEGIDLNATLSDPAKPARPTLMFAYKNVQRAVRDDRWKLIRYPLIDRTQLFDLAADPQETSNLAGKPEHAATLARLTALLEEQQVFLGDTAPLKVAKPKPADWKPPSGA